MAPSAPAAKPKKKSPALRKGPKKVGAGLTIRASAAWRAWLEKVASKNRSSISGLIDQAVAKYAREIGIVDLPPDRTA